MTPKTPPPSGGPLHPDRSTWPAQPADRTERTTENDVFVRPVTRYEVYRRGDGRPIAEVARERDAISFAQGHTTGGRIVVMNASGKVVRVL